MKFYSPFSRWTALAVAIAVLIALAVNFGSDRLQAARAHVLSSEKVQEKFGSIRWYFIYSARWSGSSTRSGFVGRGDFRFYIFGSNANGSVYVRIEDRLGKRTVQLE